MGDEVEDVEVGSTPDEGSVGADATDSETPESAEHDAEAEGETSDEPEELDEEDSSERTVRAFVEKKYKGSWKQFMDGLYNAQNSSADLFRTSKELREELAAVREMLSKPREDPEAERRRIAEDPGVQEASELFSDIDDQLKDTHRRQQEIIKEAGDLARSTAMKEGELARTDELERGDIEREIQRLQREERALKTEYEQIEREKRRLDKQRERASREFQKAVGAAQSNRARQAQEEDAIHLEERLVRNDFQSSMTEGLKGLGVPVDSELGSYALETVRAQLREQLLSLGDHPPIDIAEATKALFARFAKIHGLVSTNRFADKSKAKMQSLTTRPGAQAPRTGPASTPARKGEPWTAQDARNRAAEVARKLAGR